MTIAGDRLTTTWLRVADVAALMGVSANTVRRWTDAGRIAAHRSPGGHRRYLAADVSALMPGAAEDRPGPRSGEYADLQRQIRDLRAVVDAGHDLATLLTEAPWEVPEQVARRLCDLTETARCDVLVRGQRAPIVGSVCMDMILVDVTGMDVAPGDSVTIIGGQAGASIGVAEIAQKIGTIPYEVLCRVGTRIERVYSR